MRAELAFRRAEREEHWVGRSLDFGGSIPFLVGLRILSPLSLSLSIDGR